MSYDECFSEHWKARYAHCRIDNLVRDEDVLSAIIDSDFASDCPLIDEILLVHDIVRDECVKRCSISADIMKLDEQKYHGTD